MPNNSYAAILASMASPKKLSAGEETFSAVYENGALHSLKPLRLSENCRFLVTVYPEHRWQSEFDRLRKKMTNRSKAVSQAVVEAEVAQASAEIKVKRRGARRSA